MSISDYSSIVGVLVSLVGAYYAWKAFSVSVEQSYPVRNAHLKALQILPMSKELIKLNKFVAKNVDKKIYLNLRFESEDVDVDGLVTSGKDSYRIITIWYEQFNAIGHDEVRSVSNTNSLSLTINGDCDDYLFWETGTYLLKGYFTVLGHGTKQGHYGARLKPLTVS
jgi:hypothetical protein